MESRKGRKKFLNTHTTATLLFEFNGQSLLFTKPIRIHQTDQLDEVLQVMNRVQKELDQGYYAAGFVSYEAAPAFDSSFKVKEGGNVPLIWFGIFETPVNGEGLTYDTARYETTNWQSDTSAAEYEQGFQKIKQKIESGDTYQVNYTMKLHSSFSGDSFAYYQDLAKAQNSAYSAYLDIGDITILSASPELFFNWKNDMITTRPMKGTVKRGYSKEQDERQKEWLRLSEKNIAENLMIVDLLRNDLGIIAENGSVHVDELLTIEQYPTVWQMTSTIRAKTNPSVTFIDLFKALFPCGSITGAPKISTMDIIAAIEQSPRGIYCGAIGYLTPNREAVFNVPIRTVVLNTEADELEYGAGGGITWDSEIKEEYKEAYLKASLLSTITPDFQLLETIKLENGQYYLLQHHLKRLMKTADYFGIKIQLIDIRNELNLFAQQCRTGLKKVRLLINKAGIVSIECTDLEQLSGVKKVILADTPTNKDNPFLYHKTTNRQIYQAFQASFPDYFDVLLYNEKKELTEFTNGNLVLEINNEFVTPPVHNGLLPGTFREELLMTKQIVEKTVTLDDLQRASNIWFINSVRGWVEVELCY